MEASLKTYVLDRKLKSALIAENGLVLCAVVLEGTADVLHKSYERHVSNEYRYLEESLKEGFAKRVECGIFNGKEGNCFLYPTVYECGKHNEKTDCKSYAEHRRDYHNARGKSRALLVGFLLVSLRRFLDGSCVCVRFFRDRFFRDRFFCDRFFRDCFFYGNFLGKSRLLGRSLSRYICSLSHNRLCRYLFYGGFNTFFLVFLSLLFCFFLASKLLFKLLESRELCRAHQTLIAREHRLNEAVHSAEYGKLEYLGAVGALCGPLLKNYISFGIANCHRGHLGTLHHNALKESLTSDRGLSGARDLFCLRRVYFVISVLFQNISPNLYVITR